MLLVEDEDVVRTVAAEQLCDLGYQVLEAKDGVAALQLLQATSLVDLLVTDVGLPGGLNGRQVADQARERCPRLPVLFITGFAGNVLEEQLAPGWRSTASRSRSTRWRHGSSSSCRGGRDRRPHDDPAGRLAAGLRPVIARSFPFDQIVNAHWLMEPDAEVGRILVEV